ncbi:hypothetical protein AMATHDRAFT_54668 [Amanita thiersii Skay4041]|uniref:Uncharacterized protein n=1 Tax=Amanita thiersii Skay4041 TaxID=703135 RepID=A0A2A9NZI9_9AGAR|nr:hypothetical protein AMATHDRAFT_54668 [Amanita thiersii Skay4041]
MTLHIQIRASRSRSESHKQLLRARSASPSRAPRVPKEPVPPLPTSDTNVTPAEKLRPSSPDISTLLSKTPRPRRQRSSVFSNVSRISSPPQVAPRRVSDGDIAIDRGRWVENGRYSSGTDYAVVFPTQSTRYQSYDHEIEERLDRRLEGNGSDSDSSLDLHTPLPHLMVRDGLLSPSSKVLPQTQRLSQDSRSSIYSVASSGASIITKSGVMRDERDTPMRRHRHRDGRLLRGGVGLTTGLGWSDSEDEDAPSPLTRRLSSLNISRRSSASSFRSQTSHPLSRSFSSGTLLEENEDSYDSAIRQRSKTLSTSSRNTTKPRHPPTSWQTRSQRGSRLSSSSTESKTGLQLDIPGRFDSDGTPPNITRSTSESDSTLHDAVNTPSTASTLSIPLPSTPSDDSTSRKLTGSTINKNKSLPPIPALSLRKRPSNLNLTSGIPGTRPRTLSSSSVSSAPRSPPSVPLPPIPVIASIITTPRPLKLPEAYRRPDPPPLTQRANRPAVPVPTVSYSKPGLRQIPTTTSNSSSSLPLSRSISRLPSKTFREGSTSSPASSLSPPLPPLTSSVSVPELPKPKPRIGTGMVYRSSSYGGLSAPTTLPTPSKLRVPKSLTLAPTTGPSTSIGSRSISTALPSPRTPTSPSSGIPRGIAF